MLPVLRSGNDALNPSERFERSERVRKRGEYLSIQRSGRKFHSAHFVLLCVPSDARRLGITVSKRVSKRAVVRNYVRRCVREVFRQHKAAFSVGDWVVIAKGSTAELGYAQLEADLLAALAQRRDGRGRGRR